MFVGVARAADGEVYLYGTIRSDPNDQHEYGRPYYQFTLRVENSSESAVTYPHEVQCLVDVELYKLYNYSWKIDTKLNVTGTYVADQPESWSPPVGFFIATTLQNVTTQTGDWTGTLGQLINAITGIGKLLITLIVQVVFTTFGYQVPEWLIAGIIVLSVLPFLLKFGGKLPWIVVLIGVLLCISIIAYMLSGMHL